MNSRGQEDFDRDFTEMVSGLRMEGFDLDSFEPALPPVPTDPPDLRPDHDEDVAPRSRTEDVREPFHFGAAMAEAEVPDPDPADYAPAPLPPMRTPTGWAAFGWACAVFVLGALVLTIVGVRLPAWVGWAAVIAFVTALFIGWRSLPKDRDPDDDGAVV